MREKILVRAYKEGDEKNILKLQSSVLNIEDLLSFKKKWVWQFKKNPNNHKKSIPFTCIVTISNRIIGAIETMPVNIKIGDKKFRGAWLVGNSVSSEYQGRGIGTLMQDYIEKNGNFDILLSLGSTEAAYHLLKKLDWDVGYFGYKVAILNLEELIKMNSIVLRFIIHPLSNLYGLFFRLYSIIRNNRSIYKYKLVTIKCFDNRFDKLLVNAINYYPITVIRDRSYLNWRYIDCPHRSYVIYSAEKNNEVCGFIILKIAKKNGLKTGFIVDLFFDHSKKDVLINLLNKAMDKFYKSKVSLVTILNPNAKFKSTFNRYGFLFNYNSKKRLMCKVISQKVDTRLLHDMKKWNITKGDSDSDLN